MSRLSFLCDFEPEYEFSQRRADKKHVQDFPHRRLEDGPKRTMHGTSIEIQSTQAVKDTFKLIGRFCPLEGPQLKTPVNMEQMDKKLEDRHWRMAIRKTSTEFVIPFSMGGREASWKLDNELGDDQHGSDYVYEVYLIKLATGEIVDHMSSPPFTLYRRTGKETVRKTAKPSTQALVEDFSEMMEELGEPVVPLAVVAVVEPVVPLAVVAVVEPVIKPVVVAVVEPVAKPAVVAVVEPVIKPAVVAVVEPVMKPAVVEPVIKPASAFKPIEPVIKPIEPVEPARPTKPPGPFKLVAIAKLVEPATSTTAVPTSPVKRSRMTTLRLKDKSELKGLDALQLSMF